MSERGGLRAFVALVLDAATCERLARVCEELRPSLPGARWVGVQQFHLTLRFFGEIDPVGLREFASRLEEPATLCPTARVALGPFGIFPEHGAPRVLWVGVELTPELIALQRACEDLAVAIGVLRESRPFTPHVTLARWRDRTARPPLPELDVGRAEITKVVVFESRLAQTGALHTPFAEHRFRGAVA